MPNKISANYNQSFRTVSWLPSESLSSIHSPTLHKQTIKPFPIFSQNFILQVPGRGPGQRAEGLPHLPEQLPGRDRPHPGLGAGV